MNILYRVFSNSASFIVGEKSFSISKENPNFDTLVSLAKEQDAVQLLKILEHQELTSLGLTVKKGNLYYKELILPHFFYYQIQKVSEKKQLMPLINTWYTLSKKISLSDQRLFGINLVSNLIPFDDTSSQFIYFDIGENFSKNDVFFKCTNSTIFIEIKQNHNTVKEYISKLWPQLNAPLFKKLSELILNSRNTNLDLINLGPGLTHLTQSEQLEILNQLPAGTIQNNFGDTGVLLKDLPKNKVLQFFKEICESPALARDYQLLKGHNPDFTLPDFSQVTQLEAFFSMELERYKNNFPLNIETSNPELFALNKEKINEELTFVVPLINKELVDWGNELSHCIGTYGQRVVRKECFCVAIYKEEQVLYTLELRNNKIKQFRGKNNLTASTLNYKDFKDTTDFLIKHNIIAKNNGVAE